MNSTKLLYQKAKPVVVHGIKKFDTRYKTVKFHSENGDFFLDQPMLNDCASAFKIGDKITICYFKMSEENE
jgi:hypothetical protein